MTNSVRLFEPRSGLVDPTGSADCIICTGPAILYILDQDEQQWFTCTDHHGMVTWRMITGYNPVPLAQQ